MSCLSCNNTSGSIIADRFREAQGLNWCEFPSSNLLRSHLAQGKLGAFPG